MDRILLWTGSGLLLIGLLSCGSGEMPGSIDQKFRDTRTLANNRSAELFNIFNESLTIEEIKYLKYLYAHMPLSDLADYDGEYFLKHVRTVIKSKSTMTWAQNIPEDVFLRFVLPPRVNNENMDSARTVFYDELKDRIAGMSMEEATLEVNHWSHEKVEYQPADGRTSAPLATVKSAHGRCGEETTFTITALRAVSIPARQVYTPRWAHSDNNHAWVEAWIDGEWRYFGACEPEPVLDRGWFNEYASRAMLLHTRVFGGSDVADDINFSTSQYDDVNVTDRYAHTFKQIVQVRDALGNPVQGASVEYQIYNYAEFYPLTTKTTDENGLSYFTTGYGELLIWVYTDDHYGHQKARIAEQDTVTVILSDPEFVDASWILITPPASDKTKSDVTIERVNRNKMVLQYEDSVRNAYVSTFISEETFKQNYSADLWDYVKASRGNHDEIVPFIDQNRTNTWAGALLDIIAAKDLRDTKNHILTDHLTHASEYADDYAPEIFTRYILNPRIELEMLLPYRGYLLEKFSEEFMKQIQSDPHVLIDWVRDEIQIVDDRQSYNLPVTPIGVERLRVSDRRSRNIFLVAAFRTFGVPARLEPGTYLPQYLGDDGWRDVHFDGQPEQEVRHAVRFEVTDKNLDFTPQYHIHFSIAKFENNRFNTFELAEMEVLRHLEEGGEIQLSAGTYRLITSNRPSSDKILVDLRYLEIDHDMVIKLDFPKESQDQQVHGKLDREVLSGLLEDQSDRIRGSEYITLAMIQPDKEPSKHILNDIQAVRADFEKVDNSLVFIIQRKDLSATFDPSDYPNLPDRTIFKLVDQDPAALLGIELDVTRRSSPEVMIVNPQGVIIYYSGGYRIGIGTDLLRACRIASIPE
jgi:transglutaminase-like putative cysteine protease